MMPPPPQLQPPTAGHPPRQEEASSASTQVSTQALLTSYSKVDESTGRKYQFVPVLLAIYLIVAHAPSVG